MGQNIMREVVDVIVWQAGDKVAVQPASKAAHVWFMCEPNVGLQIESGIVYIDVDVAEGLFAAFDGLGFRTETHMG
jgi:hypothetical protein